MINKKFIKKTWHALSKVVLFGVIGIAALILVQHYFFPEYGKILVVRSGSMEPAIRTGSIVVVWPLSNYGVGDVITFEERKGGDKTTHRITRQEGESSNTRSYTKGDANKNEDPLPVSTTQINGKVLFSLPYVGYMIAGARTKVGFLVLVLLPGIIIIIEELKKIYAELNKKKAGRKKKVYALREQIEVINLKKLINV